MTGTVPGQELAQLMTVIACGLLIFVPRAIYLCVKVGIKPTLGVFTIGLWPSKWRRRRQAQDDKTSVGSGSSSP